MVNSFKLITHQVTKLKCLMWHLKKPHRSRRFPIFLFWWLLAFTIIWPVNNRNNSQIYSAKMALVYLHGLFEIIKWIQMLQHTLCTSEYLHMLTCLSSSPCWIGNCCWAILILYYYWRWIQGFLMILWNGDPGKFLRWCTVHLWKRQYH